MDHAQHHIPLRAAVAGVVVARVAGVPCRGLAPVSWTLAFPTCRGKLR
jgi:hypothetical protein